VPYLLVRHSRPNSSKLCNPLLTAATHLLINVYTPWCHLYHYIILTVPAKHLNLASQPQLLINQECYKKDGYLPFLCRELALAIQRDLSIETDVSASYDFCLTQILMKHDRDIQLCSNTLPRQKKCKSINKNQKLQKICQAKCQNGRSLYYWNSPV